jgi:hypothetical protein
MADSPNSKRSEERRGSDSSSSKKEVANVAFDSKRAMGYLDELCKIGPRISGSEGMKKQQEYLRKHFEGLGATVQMQEFRAKQKSKRDKVDMANMIITWHPDRMKRVVICSHYDTRPIADQEENQRDWTKPFVSANDGTSGVALLMELAHHMKDLKTPIGVDFVLFDGEEYIYEPATDDYFFGSKHFAAEYRKKRDKVKYLGAVLLDMIGGKNARFPMEPYSYTKAGALTERIWKIAEEQKCTAFKNVISDTEVQDDHIALNNAGIPAVDIIDFSYKHWHKLSDVPENCSADGLEQVARVLGVWMQQAK